MYTEYRKLNSDSSKSSASSQDMWDRNFQVRAKMEWKRNITFSIDKKFRLIRHYIQEKGRVLDAGCGLGHWVAFLNARGWQAEGSDYSPNLVKRVSQAYPYYSFHVGDIRAIPLRDNSFNGVISWGVIEHAQEEPLSALKEFRRILMPGGTAIITVPIDSNRSRVSSFSQFPYSEKDEYSGFFQYLMEEKELNAFVKQAGLKVLESGTLPGVSAALLFPNIYQFTSSHRYLRRILHLSVQLFCFWKRDCRNMIYCVARNSP